VTDAGRYDTSGLVEAQYEPGSGDRVLRNLRGITDPAEMEIVETRELVRVTEQCLDEVEPDQCFTAVDIVRLHREWLGSVYPWAGNYRQVNMSKGGFPFAAPAHLPSLMAEFERTVLSRHTPCRGTVPEAALSLATVHVELVLIHPFREGNGRIARLVALLMGLQAGLPPLDFSGIEGEQRERYFAAVRAGLDRDYRPMAAIFVEVIERSVASAQR
jgi:cell filamentation protein